MTRMIDVGIDLGTTNSTIAVMDGADARVIPNSAGSTVTPSAVWVDKKGRVRVGLEARKRAVDAPGVRKGRTADAVAEFKEWMGDGAEATHTFPSGAAMSPEELSAEVLKSLRLDYQTNTGKELKAAVITVPAAFENSSTAATQRAAELAGFQKSPLLHEPVAASLAYGFQSEAENVYWFVYDFGGGTFDAAVVRVRDGQIQVVSHNGHNHLGGKLIDWDVVEKRVVPSFQDDYDLPDFYRGNNRWDHAFGFLKYWAEQAKIQVCRTKLAAEVEREGAFEDASGNLVDVDYLLTPEDMEELTAPYVERTLELCRKTLDEAGLGGADLAKVLMVGGSTLNPWVREAVAKAVSPHVEYGIDPVTVVARGAAIFASMQEGIDDDEDGAEAGTWIVEVIHEPVGNVQDPDIGGRIRGPDGQSLEGYTVRFVDTRTNWSSGWVQLDADGTFETQLWAERRQKHEYAIELRDPTGTLLPVWPPTESYTVGVRPPRNPPVTASIGIGRYDGTVQWYFEKNDSLPAKAHHVHKTAVPVRAGVAEDVVRLPIVQGEHTRTERNRQVGTVTIRGSDLKADLLIHSDIEVFMTMNESQILSVNVHVTDLEADFNEAYDPEAGWDSVEALQELIEEQYKRVSELRTQAEEAKASDALRALDELDRRGVFAGVEEVAQRARRNATPLKELDRAVRDLAAAVDTVEDLIELPVLEKEARELRTWAESVSELGDSSHRRKLKDADRMLERALDSGDGEMVRLRTVELRRIAWAVLAERDEFPLLQFESLSGSIGEMRDPQVAQRLVAQGHRQVQNGDTDGLRATNRQLQSLLPRDTAESTGGSEVM